MPEVYRGFTLNVTNDTSWGSRENTFHKAIIDKVLDEYILLTQKAAANGVATLDGSTKIPIAQLPASVTGAIYYQGVWNASTNSPTLGDSGVGGVQGDYYVVSVAGSTSIEGITDWKPTDWLVNNGTTWDKIDNSEPTIIKSNNHRIISTASPYIILTTYDTLFINTDGGAVIATLPAGVENMYYRIINSGTSGNNALLNPNGSEHLMGVNAPWVLQDGDSIILSYNTIDGWY